MDSIIESSLPNFLPKKFERGVGSVTEKLLLALKVVKFEKEFDINDFPLRTHVFLKKVAGEGLNIEAQRGPYGYTGAFKLTLKSGKKLSFRGLPLTNTSTYNVDDKSRVKKSLKKQGFPYTQGQSFWFFQQGRALRFAKKTGFPLVIKPKSGSVARHVTTNINSIAQLKGAIKKVNQYSSGFIVERYIPDSFVHRATVVGDEVFCVKQLPAHIIGDEVSSIAQLVEKKNADSKRKVGTKTDKLYHEIVYSLNPAIVPRKDEVVYLQKDPFMKLGGELEEVTKEVHPENIKLFQDIAKYFGLKLVGMDFIASDITKSWRTQLCAILELNSLPCIELHHYPTKGEAKNVARKLLEEMMNDHR